MTGNGRAKTSRQGVRLVPVGYVNEDRSHGFVLVSFELSSEDCSRLELTQKLAQKKSLEGKYQISPIDLRAEARASSSGSSSPPPSYLSLT